MKRSAFGGVVFAAGLLVLGPVRPVTSSIVVNRVIQIAATGPLVTDNCDNLRTVLNGLVGLTSPQLAYLVVLEPGEYNCGGNSVEIPSHVTVRGSGVRTTTISGSVDSTDKGVIAFENSLHSELRDVTVVNFTTGTTGIAISAFNSFPNLDGIKALSTSATDTYGLVARSTGTDGTIVQVRDSEVLAFTSGLVTSEEASSLSEIQMFQGFLDGGPDTADGGDVLCFGTVDSGFTELTSACL